MAKALVTGANGFAGANLVRELLAAGDEVKCMVRATADTSAIADLLADVEVVFGDVRDARAVERAMDECDRVYHTASRGKLTGEMAEFIDINVIGTRHVCRAAAERGVERVVLTSSTVAVGRAESDEPANEDTVWNLGSFDVPFATSLHLAELEGMRAAAQGLDVVLVCPAIAIGAHDHKPSPGGELVLRVLRGKMPVMTDVELSIVHAGDVALGHRLAMERGRRGERYILTNQTVKVTDLAETVAKMAGVKAPGWSLPGGVIRAALTVRHVLPGSFFQYFHRQEALITGQRFDNERSRQVLGLSYRPLAEAYQTAIDWFRESGKATGAAAAVDGAGAAAAEA